MHRATKTDEFAWRHRTDAVDKEGLTPVRSSALEENVQAIKRLTNRLEELAEPATSTVSKQTRFQA